MSSCDESISSLEKVLEDMKKEKKKKLEEAFKNDLERMIDSTTIQILTTPTRGLFNLIVPKGCEMHTRFWEIHGNYGYPGTTGAYKGHKICVQAYTGWEHDQSLEIRVFPFPEQAENVRNFIKILPNVNASDVQAHINECIKQMVEWKSERLEYESYLKAILDSRNPIS
jgi:hypothetical protein